jgi:hypothetical protein
MERVSQERPVDSPLGADSDKLTIPQGTDDAVQDLVNCLSQKAELQPLADAWRKVATADESTRSNQGDFPTLNWMAIALVPANARVFEFREHAARQALKSIMNAPAGETADQPVATLLVNALEQSCATGSKSQIRRLLDLDRAYVGLQLDLHREYESIVEQLPDPVKPASDRENSAEITRYRKLLAQSTSPAAARFATEQLKRLR